jgi:anti-sigma-K factor RskA
MVDQPAEAPDAALYMSCSECRAPMREKYFSMNERPMCAKCCPKYARRIKRTDGPGAIWRVGLQGALVALVGVVALVVVIKFVPPARIFVLIPIGYYIGKRMMSSLEGYSTRRYQYLAVTLTYLCFLIGFTIPAIGAEREARNRRAENRAKMQGTLATETDAIREELVALNAQQGNSAAPQSGEPSRSEQQAAAAPRKAAADDIGPGLAFVLLLFSPVFAMMQFGMMASAMGVMALGYALYQAWKQTDGEGMLLDLSGPFRVGQGPIPAR